MEERMSTLIAEAEVNRAHLESSAGILGQQQQLEEAARKQVHPEITALVTYSVKIESDLSKRHSGLMLSSQCPFMQH